MRDRVMPLALVLGLIALFLVPAGCMTAGTPILSRQRAYDASEYAPYEGVGGAEVSGHALVKNRGGDVVYGAEDSVYLFPATRYADEWWQQTLVQGLYLADPDPRSLTFLRTTLADDRGGFRFRSLPAGDYYVVCVITWKDILVGTTAHWERDPTVAPTQVVNLGTRIHLGAGERIAVDLDQVSRHRALIEPPTLGEERR